MLSREDFVFTIGYDGPAAVVDGQAKKRFGSLSTGELAEKGLFRAAYSSAVYSRDQAELEAVAEAYNKSIAASGGTAVALSSMDRLFGVFSAEVRRVIVL
jgi:high-affinity K+ transport system ATPase subunit B